MFKYLTFLLLFIIGGKSLFAQQNSTLFFMPGTPQANFVNPAVTNDCNLIIGLPVLSSVHINAGNSAFSYNQFSKKNRIGNVSYFDSEFHTNLLFVGFWVKKNFLSFSVNEKADLFMTYPGDLFAILQKGNSQFEGETAKLGRSGAFLNYRREYAFGIARQAGSDLWWGARGKLLFGKLNTTMTKSKVDLFTDPVTFNLTFTSDWQFNSSLPIDVAKNPQGYVESVKYNGASAGSILLNRQNMGFSTDLGFIKEVDELVTVSGSILDLGFISWKTNATAFIQDGTYTYKGPIGDSIDNENYVENLTRIIQEEFGITTSQKSYMQPLSPRIYLGATYKLRDDLTAGVLGTAKINRYKITKGLTLSLNKQFSEKFTGSVSYSYLYNDLRNLGLGVKIGKNPLQFYAVSDNVLGFFNLAATHTANLRFGLHLNFGCDRNTGFGGCGCAAMQNSANHRQKMNKLLKKKK
jgi:hypothetical protein